MSPPWNGDMSSIYSDVSDYNTDQLIEMANTMKLSAKSFLSSPSDNPTPSSATNVNGSPNGVNSTITGGSSSPNTVNMVPNGTTITLTSANGTVDGGGGAVGANGNGIPDSSGSSTSSTLSPPSSSQQVNNPTSYLLPNLPSYTDVFTQHQQQQQQHQQHQQQQQQQQQQQNASNSINCDTEAYFQSSSMAPHVLISLSNVDPSSSPEIQQQLKDARYNANGANTAQSITTGSNSMDTDAPSPGQTPNNSYHHHQQHRHLNQIQRSNRESLSLCSLSLTCLAPAVVPDCHMHQAA